MPFMAHRAQCLEFLTEEAFDAIYSFFLTYVTQRYAGAPRVHRYTEIKRHSTL